jgi:hypothetical protein
MKIKIINRSDINPTLLVELFNFFGEKNWINSEEIIRFAVYLHRKHRRPVVIKQKPEFNYFKLKN